MQEKFLGELILSEYMWGLYSHSREYRKIYSRNHFPHISQILEGIHFSANTCRACIRTRANTGKKSWRIIYVLVSCQGVQFLLVFQMVSFCDHFCNIDLSSAATGHRAERQVLGLLRPGGRLALAQCFGKG